MLAALLGGLTLVSVVLAVICSSLMGRLDATSCAPTKFEGGPYFAEYYEDYVLAQVFAETRQGTYIDVGANHPIHRNVSAYFYGRGWRGITIEPNPDFIPLYKRLRPEDRHLPIGVGDVTAKLTFHRFALPDGTDASLVNTFDDAEAAKLAKLGVVVEDSDVEVLTLDSVLKQHPLPEISFLSIDVEGFEKQVLSGIDLKVHRPIVIMVEAKLPNTDIPSYSHWEKLILGSDYVFAMSDGLNQYYLRRDHSALLARFVHADMCVKMSKLPRNVRLNGWTPR